MWNLRERHPLSREESFERPSDRENVGAPTAATPWDHTLEKWHPIIVGALALTGAVASVGLLYWGASSTPRSQSFVESGGFTVWAAAIAVQGGFWGVVSIPLWREILAAYREQRPNRGVFALPLLIVIAVTWLAFLSPVRNVSWPLFEHTVKMRILTGFGTLAVGLPALLGILLVSEAGRRRNFSSRDVAEIQFAIAARAQVGRSISLVGGSIGVAVLAVGALQKAMVPAFADESTFPSSSIVLYGAFFTFLLLVVYFPVHLSLRRICAEIRDSWYPLAKMPEPDGQAFAEWLEGRKRLDEVTQFDLTVSQQLQAAIFLFTPLLSGVLSKLISTS